MQPTKRPIALARLFIMVLIGGMLSGLIPSVQAAPDLPPPPPPFPRLSVHVACWPTEWGDKPTAIAWLELSETLRPAPGTRINPPTPITHLRFIFDRPVDVLVNDGVRLIAEYGADVPREITIVTAMWSPTSGGFRYVGQVTTEIDGIARIEADLCQRE